MENSNLKLGTLFYYKCYDEIRTAIFIEQKKSTITAILKGDYRNEGVEVKINKNQIIEIKS
mgnify:CR=1 FL=1